MCGMKIRKKLRRLIITVILVYTRHRPREDAEKCFQEFLKINPCLLVILYDGSNIEFHSTGLVYPFFM